MWYITFHSSAERGEGIRDIYSLTRTRRRYQKAFPFKQNVEKVPETKKEARRRTSQYVEALLMKVYDALYFIISRTQRRYQRRRERADGVLLLRRGLLMKVYDVLYFMISRTRRRYQRRREKADGVLLTFSMKYMMPYTRSERVWINCAAILTAISAGVSLPMSIPMGVITRASCCSL